MCSRTVTWLSNRQIKTPIAKIKLVALSRLEIAVGSMGLIGAVDGLVMTVWGWGIGEVI